MKLPEPFKECFSPVDGTHFYTEAQMRQAIEDAFEEAAKVIESRKTGANELMDSVRDMDARVVRKLKETI